MTLPQAPATTLEFVPRGKHQLNRSDTIIGLFCSAQATPIIYNNVRIEDLHHHLTQDYVANLASQLEERVGLTSASDELEKALILPSFRRCSKS